MFKKVLLATDLSPALNCFTNCLLELKNVGTEEIDMVSVININAMSSIQSNSKSAVNYQKRYKKRLMEEGKKIEDIGFSVNYEVPIGIPHKKICEITKKRDEDLILIGSRGESRIQSILLGSTVANVIRLCKIPILIERIELANKRANESHILGYEQKLRSILLATDFSENSREAERIAQKLAPNAKEVHIVTVAERQRQGEEEKLKSLKEKFSEVCDNVKVKLEEGIASKNINKIADEENVSMIILGKRGKGSLKELLLGSTAEAVVRHSNKPVLLIPPKES